MITTRWMGDLVKAALNWWTHVYSHIYGSLRVWPIFNIRLPADMTIMMITIDFL